MELVYIQVSEPTTYFELFSPFEHHKGDAVDRVAQKRAAGGGACGGGGKGGGSRGSRLVAEQEEYAVAARCT